MRKREKHEEAGGKFVAALQKIESAYGDEEKEAGHCGNVVELERGEEISGEGEKKQRGENPKAVLFFQGEEEREESRVERGEEEEPDEPDAVKQPAGVGGDRLGLRAAETALHLVIERLLRR